MCKSYYVGRVWRYQRGNQNPYIEEQTTQWICRLIDQGIWYWQFTCQPYKYILDNHMSVLCSFWISTKDEELDLPSLYWIPWSTVTLLDSYITQLSLQRALYCWVCKMLHEANLFPNFYHLFYQRSKPGFRVTVTLAAQWVLWIWCGFYRSVRVHTI